MQSWIRTTWLGNWQARLLLAGAAAAITMAGVPAIAADLNDDTSYGYSGSPYDDPRYSAIYGKELRESDVARLSRRYQPSYSGHRHRHRHSSRYSSSDHSERACDRPDRNVYRSERSYSTTRVYRSSRPRRYADRCLHKSVIRQRLRDDGWYDFKIVRVKPNFAILKASKDNGDRYRIKVDRCNGEILRARLIDRSYRSDRYADSRSYRSY